ncbi:hypothetical protein HMF7854_04315 [Sphingomonas ginkgonis]|uniref:Chromosomal replication initiator DnaA C-terminal domain-containing protein n=1 Tax=Sphingomonas ginkgonis TaxID=2315330 RepID=A0A3R9Z5C4_9SPHN|nr:helix-turn-helix domain-containing protein [Sphingomonas ginkgonis]RST30134.1 hypothetical protein HMF7854_04315 [Sphingomonas ginkgonis]
MRKTVLLSSPAPVSIERIRSVVATEFGLSVRQLQGSRGDKAVCLARQLAMALAYRHTHHSNAVIGRLLGARDHSTVVHARTRIAERRHQDLDFDRRCRRLEMQLCEPWEWPDEVQLTFLDGPLFDWLPPAPLASAAVPA